jgi:hypothetical protein
MTAKKTTKSASAKAKQAPKATGQKPRRKPKEAKAKKPGALDAAVRVLEASGQPMSTQEMIEEMAAKSYWKSPGGKTPSATLYSAILRELSTKGKNARFKKVERGKFALNENRKGDAAA